MRKWSVLLATLLLYLVSCVPNLVQTPQFEMREAGLLRLNPPGLNGVAAEAVVRVLLTARNPNPIDLGLTEMNFDLFLDGAKLAAGSTPGFVMKANRVPSNVTVDVTIPINPQTLQNLFKIVTGNRVTFRIDGGFAVDAGALGKPRFGPFTIAQGAFQAPSLASQPPKFAFRQDLTRLTVGIGGAVLDLGFEVTNPAPIGYRLVAPLNLTVGNKVIAKAEAGGSIPAGNKGVIYTRFQIDPLTAGAAVLSGNFDFQITGTPTLEVPGLQSFAFPLSALFGGRAQR
ncbi:MAG: LEA type 2 family protein [Deinococcales bacterium]